MEHFQKKVHFYSEVSSSKVNWIWYPYIPLGKITILQGDPGDGKSTMMIDLIARLTTGREMPNRGTLSPINVIYQCSEDGLADTIRPRLEMAKADCSKVAFIDEDSYSISLDDENLRNAITYVSANLVVIDPFQAYLGEAEINNANAIRRVLRRLGMWASTYNCAVVLIGHLNKKSGSKELYRGLGSIDVVASARSVLQIDRDSEDSSIRIMKHVKSSLAPKGDNMMFSISGNGEVLWLNDKMQNDIVQEDTSISTTTEREKIQMELVAEAICELLGKDVTEATEILRVLKDKGFSDRTIKATKKEIGIISKRINKKWYWSYPNKHQGDSDEE